MSQTDPTNSWFDEKCRLVIFKYQIWGNIPVTTHQVLWSLWEHPSHWIPSYLARNTIFFGIHKQFLWRQCWCDKDNVWNFESWGFWLACVPFYTQVRIKNSNPLSRFWIGQFTLVIMGKWLVWTRIYSYPLLIFKLRLLKLETMELICDSFSPNAYFSFAITVH